MVAHIIIHQNQLQEVAVMVWKKISYDANSRYTYYKKWTYEFDGYNFDYKKESWWVNS